MIELFGNFSFPNNFLMKQQNAQYFAGLVRQLTELSNKSNTSFRMQGAFVQKISLKAAAFAIIIGIVCVVSSCSGNQDHWEGMFSGVTPSASSPGISTVIILNADKTYTIMHHYILPESELFVSTGTFEWNAAAKTITLDAGSVPRYLVDGKGLLQLDLQGNKVSGALAENYRLVRIPAPNAKR